MKKIRILFVIAVLTTFFTSCKNESDNYIDPRGTDYAGSESCIQCHQAQSESAFHTSHFKATAPATKENILGHFKDGKNIFVYDKDTKLVMEERNDTMYQVLYKNNKEVKAYPFEVLFGTKHAQTSAYWKNHYSYELPISYYKSINSWATSPGYSATTTNFERKVEKECYGCHSSNIASRYITTSSDSITFMTMEVEDFVNKKTLIYGIDCERCHGPAKKHVQTHLKFPDLKIAQNIVAFKNLKRQQKIDACALCHSGNDKYKMKSRFEFKPGDNLSDYFRAVPGSNDSIHYDVHGNQLGLLSQSKCFKKSETMDCMTCHNPHENASQNLKTYSKICMSCHQGVTHNEATLKTISKAMLANNCVECHMPKQDSKAIRFQQSNKAAMSSYSLRTHKIAIYPANKN
ncbi:putative CXXCH cytochrome family protein [Flavobacterium chryseum]|uniref:cytochrome c3 family protein n=1 Tax=Flavobacterium sp. P3160 TaxID=2512113 RepID=UPI001060ECF7|nr:cytochrome c3 family protein [Flavobacterium sp. P3160]TDO84218.1 putative CXXCH cytochrome family protein [Flavobacterium sp. P3160]